MNSIFLLILLASVQPAAADEPARMTLDELFEKRLELVGKEVRLTGLTVRSKIGGSNCLMAATPKKPFDPRENNQTSSNLHAWLLELNHTMRHAFHFATIDQKKVEECPAELTVRVKPSPWDYKLCADVTSLVLYDGQGKVRWSISEAETIKRAAEREKNPPYHELSLFPEKHEGKSYTYDGFTLEFTNGGGDIVSAGGRRDDRLELYDMLGDYDRRLRRRLDRLKPRDVNLGKKAGDKIAYPAVITIRIERDLKADPKLTTRLYKAIVTKIDLLDEQGKVKFHFDDK